MADDSSEITREQSESVAATNLKVLGDAPAFYSQMAMNNAVSHQQAMQQVQLATTGKIVDMIANTSPAEGGADVATLMQLIKAAQTTPPITA